MCMHLYRSNVSSNIWITTNTMGKKYIDMDWRFCWYYWRSCYLLRWVIVWYIHYEFINMTSCQWMHVHATVCHLDSIADAICVHIYIPSRTPGPTNKQYKYNHDIYTRNNRRTCYWTTCGHVVRVRTCTTME